MAFRVVLDACVLYPFSLRDTLLRLADHELYDLLWSDRILDEVTRNLIANNVMPQAGADRLEQAMRAAFEEAIVPADAITRLEPSMTNQAKDRHVLAAAVAGGAESVITANIRDFDEAACAAFGITAIHPDDFLQVLYVKRPTLVASVVQEQAADLDRPPMTFTELLDSLAKSVPEFARRLRTGVGP